MALKPITGPGSEPVPLDEAKAQCRVEHSAEDSLITSLIAVARAEAERELGRALFTQTWEAVYDAFPCAEIELGKPPVQLITSVTYIDTAGATQVLSGAAYTLDADRDPGWCLPAHGYTWPTTLNTANAVRVRFVSGWASVESIPEPIKHWIKVRVATLHKFREAIAAGVSVTTLGDRFTDRLLDPWRVHS